MLCQCLQTLVRDYSGIVFVGYYRQAPEWGLTIECHGCTVGEDSDEGRDSSLRVETGNAGLNY